MAINTKKYFKTYAQALYNNGYNVIPIIPKGKKPAFGINTFIEKHCPELNPKLQGWNRLRHIDQKTLDALIDQYATSGVGILTFNTPAIDIDIRDASVVEKILPEIMAILGDGMVLKRIGQSPKTLIPCQNDNLYHKFLGSKFYDAREYNAEEVVRNRTAKQKEKYHQIEILSNGQQFVTFGYHKKAGQDYQWVDGQSLAEIKRSELPWLDKTKAEKVKRKAEEIIRDITDWRMDKPTTNDEIKTTVFVPENYSNDDAGKLPDALRYKLSLYRHQLGEIPATVDVEEWTGVLMALHKEGEGREEFYQLGRDWSKTAGTDDGYFDKEAQRVLPREMKKSSKWRSFKKDDHPNAKDGRYIEHLYNKYCEYGIFSGFNVIESTSKGNAERQPMAVSEHKVMPFDADKMLPPALAHLVKDAANRMACSPDFIGVSMIPVLTSIIGSQAIIKVKKQDISHKVYPTAWGMIIGEPSLLKSPCVQLVMAPLNAFQTSLEADFKQQMARHKAIKSFHKELSKDKKEAAKEMAKTDPEKAEQMFIEADSPDIEEPSERHLIANDTSVEQMQIMMKENHEAEPYAGMLYFRDELSSHLENLSREDKSNERGFFMQCFNGYGSWRVNRVTRDKVVIANTNISILGTIQPAKITKHVRGLLQGSSNDGLLQRYQFAIYPEKLPRKWVDKPLDIEALEKYEQVIEQLLTTDLLVDGQPSVFEFDDQAQALYQKFYEHMCQGINNQTNHSALQNHLAKMDKTIATLALVFELVNNLNGHNHTISIQSMALAYQWFDYLKSHAEAVYSVANHADEEHANLILARKDKLPNIFTVREIVRKRWMGLASKENVISALNELEEIGMLQKIEITQGKGQTTKYRWLT